MSPPLQVWARRGSFAGGSESTCIVSDLTFSSERSFTVTRVLLKRRDMAMHAPGLNADGWDAS